MKKIIILMLFITAPLIAETYKLHIGKTTCIVTFSADYTDNVCVWENGTVTKLELVSMKTGEYYFSEYKNSLYTGTFYFYEFQKGYYLADCLECNNKKFYFEVFDI